MKPWPTDLVQIKVRRLPLLKRRHRKLQRQQDATVFLGDDTAGIAGEALDEIGSLFD